MPLEPLRPSGLARVLLLACVSLALLATSLEAQEASARDGQPLVAASPEPEAPSVLTSAEQPPVDQILATPPEVSDDPEQAELQSAPTPVTDVPQTATQATTQATTTAPSTDQEAPAATSEVASDLVSGPEAPLAAAPALTPEQSAALAECRDQAAPQQYGGPAFADLQPDRALAACEKAWQLVPDQLSIISAYIGRVLEAQGEVKAAYWLYKRAVADDLPIGYGLLAYRLMRQGDDDAKAALLAETGHALGDWNGSNVLATLYAQDRVPGKGPADALAMIEYVAEQGSPFAQYLTAWLYETHGQAPAKALGWYEKAVENGEQAAAAFLADLLERGVAAIGAKGDEAATAAIAPNYARAAELYWQALKRGDAWAAQQFTERGTERPAPVLLSIQQELAKAGFSVGEPDGVFGRRTEGAIKDLVARATAKQ